MMENQEWVPVGEVLKTKGFDGSTLVKFDFLISKELHILFILEAGQYKPLLIEEMNYIHNDSYIIKWEGYDSKEIANKLNREKLYVLKTQFDTYFEPNEEEILLIDYDIYNRETLFGELEEIIETRGEKTFNIRMTDKKHILVPWHKKYVISIDEEHRKIVLNLDEEYIEMFSS